MKNILLIATSSLLIFAWACQKDDSSYVYGIGSDVSLSLSVDKEQIYEGESVTFSFDYQASSLAIFTGDDGYDYANSYYGLMDGITDEELVEDVYLNINPDITPYKFDFASYPSNDEIEASGIFDMVRGDITSATASTTAWIGSYANIEQENDVVALHVDTTNGGANETNYSSGGNSWSHYMRYSLVDEDGSLGKIVDSDKTLKIKLKFGKASTSGVFQLLCTLVGRDSNGESKVVKYGDYANKDYPSTDFVEYSFDLTTEIAYWESKALITMDYIEQINIVVRDFDEVGWKEFWVESIEFGDKGYYPLSVGHSVTTYDSQGSTTYDYTYEEVGTYTVTAIAANNGSKTSDQLTIEVLPRPDVDQDGDFGDMESGEGSWAESGNGSGDFEDLDSTQGEFDN